MAFKFLRSEVAEKYFPGFDIDQYVTVPGLYQGMLSNITLTAANKMIRTKTNLLIEKNPVFKTKEKVAALKAKQADSNDTKKND